MKVFAYDSKKQKFRWMSPNEIGRNSNLETLVKKTLKKN